MVILLAEDDVGLQFFVWRLLRDDGFSVLAAGDGIAALEVSRNHPGAIDLLLSDVEMPRMGGLELARSIKAERPGIKVIMMSGVLSGREQVSTSE
jgi:CheY-like chemotaxis protein